MKTNYKYKIEMCDIIRDKIHCHVDKTGIKNFHYSVILPSGVDNGWCKKVAFGSSENIAYKHMPSKHAEIDAYNKIRKYKNMPKKIDIFVIRLSRTGLLAASRPCYHCIDMLEKTGLNIIYIYYSNSSGEIVREIFKNMKSSDETYISSGVRTREYHIKEHKLKNKK
jgi:hypothetical protein